MLLGRHLHLTTLTALTLACLLAVAPAMAADRARIADVRSATDGLAFDATGNFALTLTVTGPEDFVSYQDFAAGGSAFFDASGLADGVYNWELRSAPALDAATRAALARARQNGDQRIVQRLRAEGKLPTADDVQSGVFTIRGGAVVDAGLVEESATSGARAEQSGDGFEAATEGALDNLVAPDQVIADDLIVQGSACVGQDCVNGESFGFDTLRLKENNLRIKFQDTSNSGSFPSRDWQLTANDSSNGGADKFSIDDIDGGRTPFTIEAGAPSNSLYVDDGGNVGFGTSTPVVNLHVVEGNTPTLRLQQDGSSGFTPQTWDVAGNEANFFVRDATNGSTLPFKIVPGAATNALYIANDGDVGIRDATPDARFDVDTNDANAQPAIRGFSSATSGAQDMLTLEVANNNNLRTNFGSTGGTVWNWRQTYRANQYNLELDGGNQLTLDNSGNLTITGTYSPSSDRNAKENVSTIEPNDILDRLARIPVHKWNYITDAEDTPHIGPMAQDFYAAFGVGSDDKHISTTDADGVAFAAIQALNQRLLAAVERLEEQNQALEERLRALEAMEP